MSTISTTINHGVTLGQPGYLSPLTITSAGYVNYAGAPSAVYSHGSGTVVNYGRIRSGAGNNSGVELLSVGSLDNHGTIVSNWYGVYIYGGRITNEGAISSADRFGVFGRGVSLTIVNAGLISGAEAINALSGAMITNTGTISGLVAVQVNGGIGSLVNSSVIAGGYGAGVNLEAGGSVTNTVSGYISSQGKYAGVSISGGAGVINNSGTISGYRGIYFYASGTAAQTVIDSGTIVGSGGTAVAFGAGNDLLQLQPGSLLIQGTVDGGGGSNTLEFTSAASIGTLTGVGASFTNFGTGTVDKGARWVLAGSVTLGPGVTLTDNGTLTDSGALSNAGRLSGGAGTNGSGAVVGGAGSNGITLSSGSLNNTGTVAGGAGGTGGNNGPVGYAGGRGGIALNLTSGTISNSGLIAGGAGGTGGSAAEGESKGGLGGNGGVAVTIAAGSLLNTGTIRGGSGGPGGSSPGDAGDVGGDGGNGAVGVVLTTGTISNSGLITGGAGGNSGVAGDGLGLAGGYGSAGVAMAGGSLANTGTIVGGAGGKSAGTGNDGGAGGIGVRLSAGSLTNSGTISGGGGGVGGPGGANGGGGIGVYVSVTALTNNGTILGGNGGISSGTTASGGAGVFFKSGGTLIDSGFIAGGDSGRANAVTFGTAASRLVLDPGASFNGSVVASKSFTNVLELAPAASAGTLTGFGTQFTNFAQITIDAAASWTLTGANTFAAATTLTNAGTLTVSNTTLVDAGIVINDGSILMDPSKLTLANLTGTGEVFIGADDTLVTQGTVGGGETIDFASQSGWLALTPADFSGEIVGFFSGDTIDLTGITDASSPSIINGNTLQIEDGGNPTILLTLDPNQDYTGVTFTIGTDSSPNHYDTVTTDLTCFAEGTRLDTPGGPVAVEALRAGDLVLTWDGGVMPVCWIGHSIVATRFADPLRVLPIRIHAGALGPNCPTRDLLVSPNHGVLIGEVLVHASALMNGVSVTREYNVPPVFIYYHVELATHSLLLAEGAPAESFLDGVEMTSFANWADRVAPDAVEELPFPRVRSIRQLPRSIRKQLAGYASALSGERSAA